MVSLAYLPSSSSDRSVRWRLRSPPRRALDWWPEWPSR